MLLVIKKSRTPLNIIVIIGGTDLRENTFSTHFIDNSVTLNVLNKVLRIFRGKYWGGGGGGAE